MRAVIGLGNPEAKYERTRHNAGFWFLERLAEEIKVDFRAESKFKGLLARGSFANHDLLLLKPSTYMNLSGEAAQPLASFYKLKPAEILIVHDDLDLPPGTLRLKRGGGHGGHNGLRSLHQHLGSEYLRLRVGIGHPGHRDRVLGYVLGRPDAKDAQDIEFGIEDGLTALRTLLTKGWDPAVQQLHTQGSDTR